MCLLIWDICNDSLLLLRTKITIIPAIKNSLVYLIFNVEYFYMTINCSLAESYSDPEDTSLWFFDKNGA